MTHYTAQLLQRTPTEAGSSLNGSAAEDQQLEEVPRTVSLRAKRALTAVQSHAYMLANNLRAPLRASMLGVAYLRQLAWTPDARFTSLLQAHFEAREAELEAVLHDETEPPVDGAYFRLYTFCTTICISRYIVYA
jgi:hypothetical protein